MPLSMLLFYRATNPDLPAFSEDGLSPNDGSSVRLCTRLEDVPADPGPVIVVAGGSLPDVGSFREEQCVRVASVPPEALLNVDPYRPPRPVTAAGGYVTCPVSDGVAVLLIFRRGVWDLPKGTQDPGEEVAACARREVREEVGIHDLDVSRNLGVTRHGYSDGDAYAVKTTHWFLMQTDDRSFEPEQQEGIERVARARWDVARRHLGYENLRRHMDRIESTVRDAVGD